MVNKQNNNTPIIITAVTTLVCLYIQLSLHKPFLIVFYMLICSFFLCFAFLLRTIGCQTKGRVKIFISISIGIVIALIALFQIRFTQLPLKTLAIESNVSNITCKLVQDPVPYGQKNYKALAQVLQLGYKDTSKFSAKGTLELIIPKQIVEQAYPGSISRKTNTDSLYCKGAFFSFSGYIRQDNQQKKSLFFVDTEINNPKKPKPRTIDQIRAVLRLRLMRLLYEWKDAGGFLLALTSGEKAFLSTQIALDFNRTGLAHILALSGMHLSLVSLIASNFGKKIGGIKIARTLVSLVALFFVWFAGATPSLRRALIMVLASNIFAHIGLSVSLPSVLALSICIQICFFPNDAGSLAFMLSYGALAGIVLCSKPLLYITEQKIPKKITSPFIASIGAQLITTPIIVYSIGVLAPIGIIASVVVSPLANLFMIFGACVAFLSALFPFASPFIQWIPVTLYNIIQEIVSVFSKINPLSTSNAMYKLCASLISVVTIYVILVYYSYEQKRRNSDALFAQL